MISACVINISLPLHKATVTVVDVDSSTEEKIVASSLGSATGLNLREIQKIYFGGLPTIGNYRYTHNAANHSYTHFESLIYMDLF